MAVIRKKELKSMPAEKLKEKYAEIKKEMMKANMQIAGKQNPDKPGRIKQYKKTLARIKTIQSIGGGR